MQGGAAPRVGAPLDHTAPSAAPLSLKARETASLSLKHIFEQLLLQQQQQQAFIASSSSNAANTQSSPNIFIHDDLHIAERPILAMAAPAHATYPDLDLKLATPSPDSTSYTDINNSTSVSKQGEHNSSNGQLTIFFAGSVCVYEDVPVAKAKALMLLASESGLELYKGNYTSNATTHRKSRPTTPSDRNSLAAKPAKTLGRSQAELPFARKASLARFLEKRKDRVEEKLQVVACKGHTSSRKPPSKRLRCTSPMPD